MGVQHVAIMLPTKTLLILCIVLLFSHCSGLEFDVGGEHGWVVPKEDHHVYNHWASNNRFTVGDTLRFKYKKDSVMVVATEKEYDECKSTHPLYFSNTGDTTYNLTHSGTFYFISGVAGHCHLGQRIIVKVLTQPINPSPADTSDEYDSNGGGDRSVSLRKSISVVGVLFVFLFCF